MTRIVTYNVHGCVGTDRRLSPERIAETLASLRPDIVALQELDVGRRRSGGVDQPTLIADLLGMDYHFHPASIRNQERYGDAIMTALPSRLRHAANLPGPSAKRDWEPRGALWVETLLGDRPLQVINTHLGLSGRERLAQVDALLGPAWLGHPDCEDRAMILTGDFNAPPPTAAYRRLCRLLTDASRAVHRRRPATFPSRLPLLALDHVFFQGALSIDAVEAIATGATRLASDHLPLVVDFHLA